MVFVGLVAKKGLQISLFGPISRYRLTLVSGQVSPPLLLMSHMSAPRSYSETAKLLSGDPESISEMG